jgi:hypothetical protein
MSCAIHLFFIVRFVLDIGQIVLGAGVWMLAVHTNFK